MLTPMEQIKCHEDQVLKMYNMRIMNAAPSSLDSQLVGRMISISFRRDYTAVFTKKKSQKVFFPVRHREEYFCGVWHIQ
jgi:hypothetical protein